MTQRTADVTITANVRGALAGFEQLRGKVKQTSSDMMKSATDNEQAWTQVGHSMLAIGALAGAGVALAVSKFAEFDKAISGIEAATHESAASMGQLREAALQAGAETVFTATEAANAIEELAKAGISTSDVLGGALAGSLDLASAGSLGVADAASIAATAMTQFKLKGSEVPHIADLLAAGAGKAQGSVEDLSAALNQGGLVAAQTGLNIEETTGTLAAFASAGLLGSDAGTSFKTMLQRLTPISDQAKAKMDELGISAYDAQGNFIGMEKFAGNLQGALKDLTPEARNSALGIMFGSDAVRAASVIYNQGAEGIKSWTDKVDDSGYAAETARLKLDNLSGDVEKLGGSFDTALIKSGSGANDMLRALVQTATNAVDAFGKLPDPVQGAALTVGVLVAGIGLLGGAFMTVMPKIAATKAAMDTLNISVGGITKKGAIAAVALTALAGAAGSYGNTMQLTADDQERLNQALKNGDFSGIASEFQDMNGYAISFKDTLKKFGSDNFWFNYAAGPQQLNGAIKGLTFGLVDLGAWADKDKAKLSQMSNGLAEMAKTDLKAATGSFNDLVKAAGGGDDAIKELLAVFPEYKAQLTAIAAEQGKTNLSTQDYIDLAQGKGTTAQQAFRDAAAKSESALQGVGAAADDSSGKIKDLGDQIRNFGSITLDANAAQRGLQQAVDDATASFNENGATLDITTQAGRDNAAALDEIARAAADSAAATWEKTGSEKDLQDSLATSRDALILQAQQYGMTEEDAKAYADQVLATPEEVITKVTLQGVDEASLALQTWYDAWGGKPPLVLKVGVMPSSNNSSALLSKLGFTFPNADGGMYDYQAFASGGFATGIYKGRPGGIHKFAEPETNWEAYISGKPGQESRNRKIATEALNRLGGNSANYASGTALATSSVSNVNTSGNTFNATFALSPQSGQPLADQVFSAARRLKVRTQGRR
jgi:TP901 family phage tail tape measure protein